MSNIINPLQSSKTIYWLATLTYSNGLTDEHISKARLYFESMEFCLATHEKGSSGSNDHIHSLFASSKDNKYNRRQILKNVYNLPVKSKVDPNMLKVEKVKSLIAVVRYVSKDVSNSNYFVKTGFQTTWIQQQLEECFDETRFYTKWKMVKIDQAPGCIIDYCKLTNTTLTSKDDFKVVLKELVKRKINIRSWIKSLDWVYSEVMMHFGDESGYDNLIDSALRFV